MEAVGRWSWGCRGQRADWKFRAAEFGTEYYNPADLDIYFEQFAPEQVGHQPKLISIAGGQYMHRNGRFV